MGEERYTLAFNIITVAGNAKSAALMAVEAARNQDFEAAEKYLAEASDGMAEAHEVQMGMIRDEIEGKAVELNVLMVHAQDHLTMATMSLEYAKEFIALYKLHYGVK